MKTIELESITKSYNSKKENEEILFSREPGEIFGLLGPNDAGKTFWFIWPNLRNNKNPGPGKCRKSTAVN